MKGSCLLLPEQKCGPKLIVLILCSLRSCHTSAMKKITTQKYFWQPWFYTAADLKLNFNVLGRSSTLRLSDGFANVLKSTANFQFSGCCITEVLCSANDVFSNRARRDRSDLRCVRTLQIKCCLLPLSSQVLLIFNVLCFSLLLRIPSCFCENAVALFKFMLYVFLLCLYILWFKYRIPDGRT